MLNDFGKSHMLIAPSSDTKFRIFAPNLSVFTKTNISEDVNEIKLL
jgi:hypothetical protein